MNLEKNKKTIMEIILFTILLLFVFNHIGSIFKFLLYCIQLLMPFIIGLVLAFVINVLLNVIEKKWLNKFFAKRSKKVQRLKRPLSLVIAVLLIILLISTIFFLVVPELKNAIQIFAQNLPSYATYVSNFLNKIGVDESQIQNITKAFYDLKEMSLNFIRNNKETLLSNSFSLATGIVSGISNIVLGIVFAFYILAQKETLSRQVQKLMHAYLKDSHVEKINEICRLSSRVCANFISGQCMEACIIGVLCFLGMLILRLPYAATISVLIGFTALIPVFGAFIGTVVGAFLIFMSSPIKAIVFVIFILLLQQVEGNFIYPKVVGKSIGLPGIWVMLAVTIGASVAGIAGMLVSVPLCSILYSLIVANVNVRLKKEKLDNGKD